MRELKPTEALLGPTAYRVEVYRCARRWESLQLTDRPDVRFCGDCQQPVFQVVGVDDVQAAVAARRCVSMANEVDGVPLVGKLHDPGAYSPGKPLNWEE